MNRTRVTGDCRVAAWALAAGLFAASGGCARQPSTLPKPPDASAQLMAGADQPIEVRSEMLTRQSGELATLAERLPGATDAENRQLFQRVFSQLAQTLPLLVGPEPGGPFEHQVSLVNDTRTQLAGSSAGLAADPIVDNGLSAVYNALVEAARASYFQEANVGDSLKQLNVKLNELDQTPGAAHALVASEATRQIGRILQAMASTLAARVAETGGGGGMPATAPASSPAAAEPASPVSVPAPVTPPTSPEPAPTTPPAPATSPAAPETPAAPAPATMPAAPDTPATPAPPAAPDAAPPPAAPAPETPATPPVPPPAPETPVPPPTPDAPPPAPPADANK